MFYNDEIHSRTVHQSIMIYIRWKYQLGIVSNKAD